VSSGFEREVSVASELVKSNTERKLENVETGTGVEREVNVVNELVKRRAVLSGPNYKRGNSTERREGGLVAQRREFPFAKQISARSIRAQYKAREQAATKSGASRRK
jgi:hypothetical protein